MDSIKDIDKCFTVKESEIFEEVKIIQYSKFNDYRGSLFTTFHDKTFERIINKNVKFIHDKYSTSKKNVLRGIHGDEHTHKLITCLYGEILQVIVDFRKESKTYKKHQAFKLNQEDGTSILIPPRFGNSYYVISEFTVYHYKLAYDGKYKDFDSQFSYKWNDPDLGIKWPCDNPILSKRDR